MKNSKYIEIKYDNATLRINRNHIIATINCPGSQNIEIYTVGTSYPFHITTSSATATNEILNDVWETPEEVPYPTAI